jgi:WD40 repeat protein
VAFSPDGQTIASASYDGTVRLWNATTGEERQKLEGHDSGVRAVAFSPGGQTIASASEDGTVRLWNATTGEERQKLEGHDDGVTAVAFSPDGQTIASASEDGTVRLWNATTGEERQKLEGHDSGVTAVAFSPDGQTIASASYDQTVRLWNATTGEQVRRIEVVGFVSQLVFAEDGRSLETNKGTFDVDPLPLPAGGEIVRAASLQLKGEWVRHRGEDVLWLPYEYRGICSASYGNRLVTGQASGVVSIFGSS